MQKLIAVSKRLLDRAIKHDASKLEEPERSAYIDPVWELNTTDVPYGSDRYKELISQMGEGWKHHELVNDHHVGYFEPHNPIKRMNLFVLMEMCCDWIAAASKKNNDPELALDQLIQKYNVDEQLQQIIRNTIDIIKRD